MIIISIKNQQLRHRKKTGVWQIYPISTASKGVGNIRGSWQTPTGRHHIAEKFGGSAPMHTVFVARKAVGHYRQGEDDPDKDWILTRIIRLSGAQVGFNRHGIHDTFQRYIYIHGTHQEEMLGTPASHGCIRMANLDIIALFEQCECGEIVYIG